MCPPEVAMRDAPDRGPTTVAVHESPWVNGLKQTINSLAGAYTSLDYFHCVLIMLFFISF